MCGVVIFCCVSYHATPLAEDTHIANIFPFALTLLENGERSNIICIAYGSRERE